MTLRNHKNHYNVKFLKGLARLDYNPKNIIIFAILLGGVAHVMLFQDGYWQDFMWISASLTVIIPALAYRYMKISKQKRKQRQTYADI